MTSGQEILLTPDEIVEIETFADKNPIYRNELVMNFGTDIKTVYKTSPIHGLILIKGNEHTGFEHINYRHEFWTVEPFWKDNPSRFKTNSIPWLDYIKIADSIYGSNNLNLTKNKHPDQFDLYTGRHTHSDNSAAVYNLITYKNSKIIHTLFPAEKTNNINKPKKFGFKRGDVTAEDFPTKDLCEIKVPYFNDEQKIKYTLLIRKSNKLKSEKAFVLIHNDIGEAISFVELGERSSISFDSLTKELFAYQYNDLKGFEENIMHIDKQRTENK